MMTLGRIGFAAPLVAAIMAAAPSQERPQIFRAGTTDVLVDVSVERKSAPIAGLTAADFDVLDDGAPQTIALADPTAIPVDVSLLFDRGSFGSITIGNEFAKTISSMSRMLQPTDRLRVITFATEISEILPMSPVSQLPPLLDEALRKNDPGRGSGDSDPRLDTSLSDALLFAVVPPIDASRRHLVVAFSSSLDQASVLMFDEGLVPALERSGALVVLARWDRWRSAALPSGLSPLSLVSLSHDVLQAAAEATGGEVRSATDGVKAFKEILGSFRQRYFLHFTPKDMDRKGWHEVTVRVPKLRDVTVRARRGYFVQ